MYRNVLSFKVFEVRVSESERILASNCQAANSYWSRLLGLIGRQEFSVGDGLLIPGCTMVHMFWMRFPIDVVFGDEDARVVKIVECLNPWRISPWVPDAAFALELPSGTLAAIPLNVGDALQFTTQRSSSVAQ